MLRSAVRTAISVACFGVMLVISPMASWAEEKAPQKPAQQGLQQRIDFGNAQILGQSIKSGAVYLMHRKKSDIKNMLEVRQNYREEIKEDFGIDKTAIAKDAEEPEKISKK